MTRGRSGRYGYARTFDADRAHWLLTGWIRARMDADDLIVAMNTAAEQAVPQGAKIGLIKGDAANIDQYVTDKALDGLYLMIGEEEHAIRQNPAAAGSAIISKVFGALR
jgi:hypothetical protein